VKFLRTLSTFRLVVLVALVAALAAGGAAIAVAASGGGPTPPAKPLDQAIHDALAAPAVDGITARIRFTNRLFPSGALLGNAGSALMSGASGRLWVTNDGRGRLELQSSAGDAQIVWNPHLLTIYDASSNTVYKVTLPSRASTDASTGEDTPPSLAEITSFLSKVGEHATVSEAQPSNVAGQPAYTVSVSPKHDGGLLGSVELAWDAAHGMPLRIAVLAQGSSSPVLELAATGISYGAIADGDVDVSPPAGAKVVDLNGAAHDSGSAADKGNAVTGLDAVQSAADFPVTAPATLVGLPRRDVRLVGGKTALVVYGQGLGAVVVAERKADSSGSGSSSTLGLPTVSLDGVTARELATQLGTVLEWQKGGVSYVFAGSMPTSAAEAAARELK
jgi:outer membrane lipoprotein-sorting protein